ncbi:TetR/AcrR family transcriptional regulator [Oceanispirochaeta crateris]|uniref:TetR/AcrR family transcriptional regulator n=1 Tax=Oceanispirochaeta crateris TaxID=2518645 RepID=A0A5C1QGH6_9SPIO|nr:TetR/AcrR family transcriptional regulator [Oceanispirochaeta crateris]QEN06547.1 TetR/AcrR family transcriptional regulator [Oceanispirochaeta crateris]
MGRREEKAQETKSRLMKNALQLFREKGYDMVTVEDITRATAVAKGTFYSYFETKSDIIVEEFWKIDRYYQDYASRNLKRYSRGAEKLRAFTRAQMRYVRDHVGVKNLKILYANQILTSESNQVIIDPERQWYQIIQDIIAGAQETGEFRNLQDPESLAVLFNRSMRSVFLDWCISDGELNLVNEGIRYCEEWLIPVLRSEP